MNEPKVAVLRHYASPYYDPQKAHEYYMRTRELKGRSTTSLNDEGKKIWSYTKNNIKSEKTAKIKEEQEKRDQKITELRAKADATKKQISSRLKELNEALTQNASDRKKSIATDFCFVRFRIVSKLCNLCGSFSNPLRSLSLG